MYEGHVLVRCFFSILQALWSDLNAHVVCRQFGFATGRRLKTNEKRGILYYDKPIMLNMFACYGNEESLSSCPIISFDQVSEKAHHEDDADVICSDVVGLYAFLRCSYDIFP